MARSPAYRLQVLYEIRERKKKEAEEAYAEKKKLVAIEQKKLDEMKQKLKDMIAFRIAKKAEYAEQTRRGELNINQINGGDRHVMRLKAEESAYKVEIDRQHERVMDAERLAAEAMEVVVKMTQEFKALEKHKEKWAKQVKKERDAKEEMEVEDIAQAQYFQRLLEELGGE